MKAALPISVLLNLGLAGGLIFVWAVHCRTGKIAAAPVAAAAPPRIIAAASPLPQPALTETVPFHWSQLTGMDYLTYALRTCIKPSAG
jgi:hypothetical protein